MGQDDLFGARRLLPPEFLHPLREKVAAWVGLPASLFRHGLVTEYREGTALPATKNLRYSITFRSPALRRERR